MDIEWISKHAVMSYPIVDLCTGVSTTNVQLPMSLILDIQLYLPPASAQTTLTNFYISEVRLVTNGKLNIYISSFDLSLQITLVASDIPRSIDFGTAMTDRTFNLVPLNATDRIYGLIYMGDTVHYNIGTQKFTKYTTKLSSRCIVPGMDTIYSLVVNGLLLTGKVTLNLGDGINITKVSQSGDQALYKIAIDLDKLTVLGTLYAGCSMTKLLVLLAMIKTYGTPIHSINGVSPDAKGVLGLTGADCVSISASGNTIIVKDTCSKPCCTGVLDNSSMDAAVSRLLTEQKILRGYFEAQANQINYMQSSLSALIGGGK